MTEDKTERENLLKKAYSEATSMLRKEYQERFNTLYKAAAIKRGVTITLRPSKEEKAKAEIKRLFAENPAVYEEFRNSIAEASQGEDE